MNAGTARPTPPRPDRPPIRVVLVSTPDCDHCERAHHILERLAREYDLQLETVAIESPAGQALAVEHAILFPPGVIIAGQLLQYGRLSEGKARMRLAELAAVQAAGQG